MDPLRNSKEEGQVLEEEIGVTEDHAQGMQEAKLDSKVSTQGDSSMSEEEPYYSSSDVVVENF